MKSLPFSALAVVLVATPAMADGSHAIDKPDAVTSAADSSKPMAFLTPTEACGPDALAVRDIPAGETPRMPATWPGLPIFIDSPGFTPLFDGPEITVTVAFAEPDLITGAAYDGVTAALRVNANVHAPLLCVVDIFDIASNDLSLPGKID